MEPNLLMLLAISAIILAAGGVVTYGIIRRQRPTAQDESMGRTSMRHPVLFNPVFLAYVLFGVLAILAIAYFFGVYDPPA